MKKQYNPWYKDEKIDWSSKDKTTIAYESAINLLKDLETYEESLDKKAFVFLSYLFAIIGAIVYKISPVFDHSDISNRIVSFLIVYTILFAWTAWLFIPSRKRKLKYSPPNQLFRNTHKLEENIKNDLCIGLDEAINYNLNAYNAKSTRLKTIVLIAVFFPTISSLNFIFDGLYYGCFWFLCFIYSII